MKNWSFFTWNFKRIYFILSFFLLTNIVIAQQMFNGKIEGLPNSNLNVIAYRGSSMFSIGECKTNKNGEFSFSSESQQPSGLYTLYAENKFEIDLLYFGKTVELNTTKEKAFSNASFNNSIENQLYFDFFKSRNNYLKIINYIKQNTNPFLPGDSTLFKLIETADNNFVSSTQKILNKTKNPELKDIIHALSYPAPLIARNDTSLFASFKKPVYLQMLADTAILSSNILFRTPFLDYRLNLLYYNLLKQESEANIRTISANIFKSMVDNEEKIYFINYLTQYAKRLDQSKLLAWLSSEIQSKQEFSGLIPSIQKTIAAIEKLKIGATLPNKKFTNIKGDSLDLLPANKNYNIIIFWSSECPHCTELMQSLKADYKKIKQKNVEIVSVSIEESKLDWANFIMTEKLEWKNLIDQTAYSDGLLQNYQILFTPKIYIIDKNMKIVAKPADETQIINWINQLNFP